ncbi:hypothetical protein WISP_95809 [Willisornis vidua]|uniref:Uncharacterized protein n=1 Tax=Willisornis vidua TaxID=1566151 RepID=A0ABQ9D583_9PASS|nr:hypothetical protein WISP_95809 [Willisornis vidua]
MRVVKRWNRLPREVVDAPSLEDIVEGQIGWGPEQSGLAEGVPAHGKGVGTGQSELQLPSLAETLLKYLPNYRHELYCYMPKAGMDKLGMGSDARAGVGLSRTSIALRAGVDSTWKEVSVPGTDSASAEFLSACSAISLEKKNDDFDATT